MEKNSKTSPTINTRVGFAFVPDGHEAILHFESSWPGLVAREVFAKAFLINTAVSRSRMSWRLTSGA